MTKREKIKNIILIIIMLVMIIFGISINSYATEHGNNYNVSFSNIKIDDNFKLSLDDLEKGRASGRLYCIEHKQKMSKWKDVKYTVKNIIHITDGKNAKGKVEEKNNRGVWIDKGIKTTGPNDWNAKLAAAIYYSKAGTASDNNTNQRQKAIWYYMWNWKESVNGDNKRFAGIDTNIGNNNEGLGKSVTKRVNKYIKELDNEDDGKGAYVEVAKDSNPTIETFTDSGTNYVRIKDIKLNFDPELASIKIEGKTATNTKEHKINNFKIRQNSNILEDINELESGTKFSILIPFSEGVTEITHIYCYTEEYIPSSIINADIAFLITGTGEKAWQNLCIVDSSIIKGEKDGEVASLDFGGLPINGDVQIVKEDANNSDIKLPNVGFTLTTYLTNPNTKTSTQYYVTSKGQLTTEYAEVYTISKEGHEGELNIQNVPIGTYTITETKNSNYGYVADPTSKVITVKSGVNKVEIKNIQKYIKLKGYVWEDFTKDKPSTRDNLYYDGQDKRLGGITVRLVYRIKDKNGNTTTEELYHPNKNQPYCNVTTTGANGEYTFEDVRIEDLGNLYVEFRYNGVTYRNVDRNCNKTNGSKAVEQDKGEGWNYIKNDTIAWMSRPTFNKTFSYIEPRQGYYGSEAQSWTHKTGSNVEEHALYYEGDESHKVKWRHDGNNSVYLITAKTIDVNNDGSVKGHYFNEEYVNLRKNSKKPIEYIDYINLGLYRREQPDIALVKDIENVKLTINGYEHIYKYAQRFENQGEYGDGFNVGVKFGEKYGKMRYSRAVYKADYEWENPQDRSKELQVYITYVIGIKNQATSLTSQVNSIVDYYDSEYEFIGAGRGINENGEITEGITDYKNEHASTDYGKLTINSYTKIDAGKQSNIYVQFKLSREKVAKILSDKEAGETANENKLLDNIAEINSYSTYDKSGNIYAGIDRDSAPGNTKRDDTNTYEDDTDSAPALQLEVANARKMSGTVFLDKTNGELMTGKERQGSGMYENGEKGISGVKVELREVGTNRRYYVGGENNTTNDSNSNTNQDGYFEISGFIPGNYELVYTWGDQTYTVQNYKGTIYDLERNNENNTNKLWYKGQNKNDSNKRYSDAIDNYTTRQEIDKELKNVKYNSNEKITKEKMESKTPIMGITVEYPTVTTSSKGDRYTYQIENVDFGIVERPRQEVELSKRVKTLKLTLANGQVVSDATFDYDNNGKLIATGEKSHMTYMGTNTKGDTNRFVKVELDNELIQGSTLEVGYEFLFYNKSEVDYNTSDYYKFGINKNDKVKITPTAIIDYLDKDWAFESEKNRDENDKDIWQAKTKEELNGLVATTVYGNDSDINNKIILYTQKLKEKALEPTQTNTVMLNVSKQLTVTDEIELTNETEIAELDKSGGSKIISIIPGDYVPGVSDLGDDSDKSETVTVTPSTGKNLNFVLPISIGLVSLITLGAGVILIKKKVLDK